MFVDNPKLIEKQDFIHLAILMSLALVIGIYMIATTEMISRDGIFYIERAQKLTSDPVTIIKQHPPGYPFLILSAHKFVSLFTNNTSNQVWIYSAQSVTLLCRLLALIPLYFIGKLLVGGKNSFWGVLILIFLPYPAQFASDVVREWPYLLFLSAGFFFLLWAAKYGKWWAWGFTGLISGLSYMLRPETAQLILYGFLWNGILLFRPKPASISRHKSILALGLLIIGFAIPVLPYMSYSDKITPTQIDGIMKSFSFEKAMPYQPALANSNISVLDHNTAGIMPATVLKALSEILNTILENLMWFFAPALIIGLYYRFREHDKPEELVLITALIIVNLTMMLLRYIYIEPTASRRWSLPLVAFIIFYIPAGLHIIEDWLNKKFTKQKNSSQNNQLPWFFILFFIGITVCTPKLFKLARTERSGYLGAVNWLKENTKKEDKIATPDRRLYFYADRNGLVAEDVQSISKKQADYFVAVLGMENKFQNPKNEIVFSDWLNKKKEERIIIYKVI